MSLVCLGTSGNREHLAVTDSSDLTLPSTGWAIFVTFYYDTATEGTNHYMYSHGGPFGSNPALQIIVTPPNDKLRIILDQSGGNVLDGSSSNLIVTNGWNKGAIVYNGSGTVRINLNGTSTSFGGLGSVSTINPSGDLRIGDASFGASREFTGRLTHFAKFDRSFSTKDGETFTGMFISPAFAQTDKIWHVEMFNPANTFDLQNRVTTTITNGATFGQHSPTIYQGDTSYLPGAALPPGVTLQGGVQWTMA